MYYKDKRIVIEIGCNRGTHTRNFLDTGTFVFGFEPNPILYHQLLEQFKGRDVLILPIAIHIEDSMLPFNITELGDLGLGSLYNYHANLDKTVLWQHSIFHEDWKERRNVLTMRLDTFLTRWDIKEVDHIHIDAQGSDLNCVKSAGTELRRIKEGLMECTYEIPLYTGSEQNTYTEAKAYLESMGYEVILETVYEHGSECDVRFKRKD